MSNLNFYYKGHLICPTSSYNYCKPKYNYCSDNCNYSGLCIGNNNCICSTANVF